MGLSLISIPLLLVFAQPANPPPRAGMPIMRSVEPASGKVGDVLAIHGENLASDSVAAVFLTAGNKDVKVPIVEQTPTSIRFGIPPEAKPGRFALMVLTSGKEPKLIEQPVKVTVDPAETAPPTSFIQKTRAVLG